jgi:3D (Asp-Asp-Asp) domain-containing protein
MDTEPRIARSSRVCAVRRLTSFVPALLVVWAFTGLVASLACRAEPGDAQQAGVAQAVGTTGAAAARSPTAVPAKPLPAFSVTAYCTGRVTQSGARVKPGMAAADPRVLPPGSTLRVDGQGRAYDGIYTVTDTGREIKGRELDLYLLNCDEAEQFGRRTMAVAVIRRGWDPKATPGEKIAR